MPRRPAQRCVQPRLNVRVVLSFGAGALSIPGFVVYKLSWCFWMILHINHIQPQRAALASSVVSTLVSIAGEEQIPPRILENLNVHLDWVQYKANFREAVTLRRATRGEELLPLIEIGVDLRQLDPETLKDQFVNAIKDLGDGSPCSQRRMYLEPFKPMRGSTISFGSTCPSGRRRRARDMNKLCPAESLTPIIRKL